MASFEDAVDLCADWPGVTVGTWYGSAGLKVGGKGFCRMWSQGEHDRDGVHDAEVMVVMVDVEEKQALIEASNGTVFSTPHYDGHGAMLIRMAEVDEPELAGFLEDSFRIKASARLLAQFDERP